MTTTPPSGPAAPPPQPNAPHTPEATVTPGSTLEQSDRQDVSERVGAIMFQIRALTGQDLGGAGGPLPRRNPLDPAVPMNEVEAGRYIDAIANRLLHVARNPDLAAIRANIKERFAKILALRRPQIGTANDSMNDRLLVSQAMLDAVYENIKDIDIVRIATNIAEAIPDNDIKRHYILHGQLTPRGHGLLERFRKGEAQPVKAILAFSAALDPEHYDPGVGGTLPAPAANAGPQRDLNADLNMPEVGLNSTVYQYLQGIAEAVEEYEAVADDNLEYTKPRSTPSAKDSTENQRRMTRFSKAVSSVKGVHDAISSLQFYYGYPIARRPGGAAGYPTPPANIIRLLQADLAQIDPTIATLPNAKSVRRFVAPLIGGLLKAEDYKKLGGQKGEPGLMGPDASDKILAEYSRRVSGGNDASARLGLASLTGRVKSAAEEVRLEVDRWAEVPAGHDPAKYIESFNKKLDAVKAPRLTYHQWQSGLPMPQTPFEEYVHHLEDHHCIGLHHSEHPGADGNDLRDVETRYHTLWYLSKILPESDEKHIPLSVRLTHRTVAEELTQLRKAIVDRKLKAFHYWMEKEGKNFVPKQKAEELGLPGVNAEYISYDEVGEAIKRSLDAMTLNPSMKHKVEEKVHEAWHVFQERKDEQKEWKEKTEKQWKEGPWHESWRGFAGATWRNFGTIAAGPAALWGASTASSALGLVTIFGFLPAAAAVAGVTIAAPFAYRKLIKPAVIDGWNYLGKTGRFIDAGATSDSGGGGGHGSDHGGH